MVSNQFLAEFFSSKTKTIQLEKRTQEIKMKSLKKEKMKMTLLRSKI